MSRDPVLESVLRDAFPALVRGESSPGIAIPILMAALRTPGDTVRATTIKAGGNVEIYATFWWPVNVPGFQHCEIFWSSAVPHQIEVRANEDRDEEAEYAATYPLTQPLRSVFEVAYREAQWSCGDDVFFADGALEEVKRAEAHASDSLEETTGISRSPRSAVSNPQQAGKLPQGYDPKGYIATDVVNGNWWLRDGCVYLAWIGEGEDARRATKALKDRLNTFQSICDCLGADPETLIEEWGRSDSDALQILRDLIDSAERVQVAG